jgi:hypothetical protein
LYTYLEKFHEELQKNGDTLQSLPTDFIDHLLGKLVPDSGVLNISQILLLSKGNQILNIYFKNKQQKMGWES